MCRSIMTLRPPFTDEVTDDDVRAAALQYVRKIAGMRAPSTSNAAPFDEAVAAVAEATRVLLGGITVRAAPRGPQQGRGRQGAAGPAGPR